ncbi:putative D,D-dipeptide transport system permease protein DdpC [Pantoea ananatis]|uniref:ABC transporter permease n=1 Tax=Pantoea ananas TaxID=553 RepID=UPI0007DADF4D|nr:ABC transporter permease [Pantoea ananatis]MCW0318779.1 putative D,D-dipeptide transport system permease protein DdpC [Pantoea ananatis]MCW0336947.1 putative D,D-dipeptide transport system permease protein DdpC [Pantoea ananatis]MCW0385116.1 putative D,D-dipeptide transport system permease protein DdpC [Pantoea ananatis]MCW0409759.1 putative D,D-dipeptide transport system permease protein DdpC [Pantoea ananatis]MCW0429961.1 putative D,D-dipeptide transport system permease protein DdpC [Pant
MTQQLTELETVRSRRRRRRITSLTIGLTLVTIVILMAVLAPLIAPYDPNLQTIASRLLPPSAAHWFGTDGFGRDLLSRVIYGARPTLLLVSLILVLTIPVGLLVGITAGYAGGWTERVLMRITDIFLSLPNLVIALALVAMMGPGLMNGALALALTSWPPFARQARAETLALRRSDYLAAARMQGITGFRLMFGHILPLCLPTAVVRAALSLGGIILAAAGLGFLGMGVQPPTAEWGSMVAEGSKVIFDQWWVAAAPGAAILFASLAFNLTGDGLRDRLDTRHAK